MRRSKVTAGLAQSFDLLVPVLPGWEGTAFHPGVDSRHSLAGLMAEFHAGVIGTRCDVMGWSFGGAVALWLALERPELVERLVLECPAGLLSIDRRIKRVNRKLLEHYGAEDGRDDALVARVASRTPRSSCRARTTAPFPGERRIPPPAAAFFARADRPGGPRP